MHETWTEGRNKRNHLPNGITNFLINHKKDREVDPTFEVPQSLIDKTSDDQTFKVSSRTVFYLRIICK